MMLILAKKQIKLHLLEELMNKIQIIIHSYHLKMIYQLKEQYLISQLGNNRKKLKVIYHFNLRKFYHL